MLLLNHFLKPTCPHTCNMIQLWPRHVLYSKNVPCCPPSARANECEPSRRFCMEQRLQQHLQPGQLGKPCLLGMRRLQHSHLLWSPKHLSWQSTALQRAKRTTCFERALRHDAPCASFGTTSGPEHAPSNSSSHPAGFRGSHLPLADAHGRRPGPLPTTIIREHLPHRFCSAVHTAFAQLHTAVSPIVALPSGNVGDTAIAVILSAGLSSGWSTRSPCRHTSPSAAARCPARSTTPTSTFRLAARRSICGSQPTSPRCVRTAHCRCQ